MSEDYDRGCSTGRRCGPATSSGPSPRPRSAGSRKAHEVAREAAGDMGVTMHREGYRQAIAALRDDAAFWDWYQRQSTAAPADRRRCAEYLESRLVVEEAERGA